MKLRHRKKNETYKIVGFIFFIPPGRSEKPPKAEAHFYYRPVVECRSTPPTADNSLTNIYVTYHDVD